MILEVSGGTHDGSTTSMYDIALGTVSVFGATNPYPWSSTISVGKRGLSIEPTVKDGNPGNDARTFTYDLSVEVVSGVDGGLSRISHRRTNGQNGLNDAIGGQDLLSAFTY
jgi:hypothetical protein